MEKKVIGIIGSMGPEAAHRSMDEIRQNLSLPLLDFMDILARTLILDAGKKEDAR